MKIEVMNFFKRVVTGAVLLLGAWFVWAYLPPLVFSLILGVIFSLILFLEWPKFHLWWLTPIYPLIPFVLLIILNQSDCRPILLFLALITFAHDTGAYLVGKTLGRTLITWVSPKKTWEGFVGGYLLSFVVGVFLCYHARVPLNPQVPVLLFPLVILGYNFAALGGDLFESYLKRRVGLDDSGRLLPGHGGLLDRFDSLLGVIVFWCALRLLL